MFLINIDGIASVRMESMIQIQNYHADGLLYQKLYIAVLLSLFLNSLDTSFSLECILA